MAIDAKMSLINSTRQRLGSMITADAMEKVINVLSDVIEGYDFRIKEAWGSDERDDLLECFLDAMGVQGRSAKTIARYRYVITKMMETVRMPIQEVARILGHEKIDTTMKYVVLNDDDVKHDYRRYA